MATTIKYSDVQPEQPGTTESYRSGSVALPARRILLVDAVGSSDTVEVRRVTRNEFEMVFQDNRIGDAEPSNLPAPAPVYLRPNSTKVNRNPIQELLDSLMGLADDGSKEDAIDVALDFFDTNLAKMNYPLCDAAILRFDDGVVRRLHSSVLVSVLGITLNAKESLRARASFYNRVWEEVVRRKGRSYTKTLLKKYR